jgi:hypothetical protein
MLLILVFISMPRGLESAARSLVGYPTTLPIAVAMKAAATD